MSIVQASNKVQRVEPLIVANTEMDDSVVSGLVERHLQDVRDLQSTDASPLFGKPIVLINCAISTEHLELLQTLPKLRMLRLENCIRSDGAKFSETYAHIGKQKNSAPLMSKVEKEHEKMDVPILDNSSDNLQALPKPGIKRVSFAGLQLFVWEHLKATRKFDASDRLDSVHLIAGDVLCKIIEYLLLRNKNLSFDSSLELTDLQLQMMKSIMDGYMLIFPMREKILQEVEIESVLRGSDSCTIGELRKYLQILSNRPDRRSRLKIWEGFVQTTLR